MASEKENDKRASDLRAYHRVLQTLDDAQINPIPCGCGSTDLEREYE